jgi:hypothetical protein
LVSSSAVSKLNGNMKRIVSFKKLIFIPLQNQPSLIRSITHSPQKVTPSLQH